ncbi:MAG: energy transducer TonB [Flavobacteriaceae bacterium]|nr:energy transducer TonB [Flavobacteriaceae bacterium]
MYGVNAPNCCPEYNGKFEYNLETRKIQFLNEQHKSSFQDDEEINDDEVQILDWTPPPFEEKVKLENEPKPFKNPNIKLTNEQKEALKQFLAICKINVNIEDSWNPKNSYLIMNALGIEETTVPREIIKTQLDKVLLDENLRGIFLHNISKMSGDYTYFFIKSFNVPNIVSMKAKDIEILSTFINNNYKYIKETPIESNSDNQKENSIKYIAVEKEAVFKGGNSKLQQYIIQNLNVPESAQHFSGKVIVNFVVNEDGSVNNVEIKQTIPIGLKNEIEKVFTNMPKWTPAQSQGKNIKMRKTYPISFAGNK